MTIMGIASLACLFWALVPGTAWVISTAQQEDELTLNNCTVVNAQPNDHVFMYTLNVTHCAAKQVLYYSSDKFHTLGVCRKMLQTDVMQLIVIPLIIAASLALVYGLYFCIVQKNRHGYKSVN